MKAAADRGDASTSAVHQHTADVIALASLGSFGLGGSAGWVLLLRVLFFNIALRLCSRRLREPLRFMPLALSPAQGLREGTLSQPLGTDEMAYMADKVLCHDRSLACTWRRMPGSLVLRRAHH